MTDINVLMKVDTSVLTSTSTQSEIDAACTLSDDNNDPSGHQDFTINASAGDVVYFTIQAKDGSTAVSFNEFTYHPTTGGDTGVMSPLPSSPDWKGTIADPGNNESFNIAFNVPSIRSTAFVLDPEIQVKPRG